MKKTLLLFLLLPFLGFAQIPTGTYVISTANTDPNLKTLALAVARVNAVGITGGPVTFLIDEDQTITSQLRIDAITNSSAVNTLTIKTNTGRANINITANMPNSSTGIPAIFMFNGTSNVIIDGSNATGTRNLTLINNDNINNAQRSIIWVASNGSVGSSNITVQNCILRFNSRNDQLRLLTGVYSGNNKLNTGNNTITEEVNTAANSNIKIINNEMLNVKDGININGNSTASLSPTGWKIQGNKIGTTTVAEKPVRGMYINNFLNYEISGNTISGVRNTLNLSNDAAAIILEGTSNGTVSGNTINDIVNAVYNNSYLTAGIIVNSLGVTNINNNIINNIYNTTIDNNPYNYHNKGQGIYIKNGSAINLYYNTIVMDYASGSAYSACLYTTGGSNINVRNNIFVNSQPNSQYAVFKNGGTFGTVSNNDYYVTNVTNRFLNKIDGNDYPGTAAGTVPTSWNTAAGDSASQSFLPTFVTPGSNYHIQDVTANNNLSAVAISGITTDIDGDTRVKPYMGADEIYKCVPTGDQTSSASESWIGYVYSFTGNTAPNPAYNAIPSGTTYLGTVTEPKNFDRDVAAGAVNGVTRNFCDPAPTDKFFVRYKMTTTLTEAGSYNFTVGSDDGIRLYVDGNLTPLITRWNQHSYIVDSALLNLTAGVHNFVLEYYEFDGSSRVAFSFGLTKGNQALPYGINEWNVYGLNKNDLNLNNTVYAGYYVDSNVNVDSKNYWPVDKSPAAATNWQGAPMPNDNFTVSYRRQGFPCGTYRIELANSDDATQIYLNDNLIFTQAGYTNTPAYINGTTTYVLNSSSKIEVRLREDGGNANVGVNLVRVLTTYTGSETVNSNTSIVISSPTVTLGSDIQVCSCTVNAGSTFNIPVDRTLTVDEDINVIGTGKLVLQNGGSLLQTSTSKTMFTGNIATAFEVQRTTNVRRYDLTYWSTPVTNPSFKLYDLSPATLGDKFFIYDPNSGWIINYNGTQVMEAGKGYSVRAPQPYDTGAAASFTGVFKGTPNNGDINPAVVSGTYNLVGNPYPSAISAVALINGNTNLGTIYLWTHNTPPQAVAGDHRYFYTSDDYTAFNLTGSTQGALLNGETFKEYIAAGQGFLAQPKTATMNFNNTMRRSANNKQFYKTTESIGFERNRVWLNLSNDQGAFKQALIGYIEGATNDLDINYDAGSLEANPYIDFYSVNEANKLTIQGRALPFDNKDVVPLGYNTTVAGEFTISIDRADGFFDTQDVYLEDLTAGKTVNLRDGNYKFTTAVGTFENRFNLRYTSKTLGTGEFEDLDNSVLVSVKSKVVKVSASKENIKEVQIYNIGGQSVYNKTKVGTNELQISNLPSGNQVLLVKVILENGSQVTKKVIFN